MEMGKANLCFAKGGQTGLQQTHLWKCSRGVGQADMGLGESRARVRGPGRAGGVEMETVTGKAQGPRPGRHHPQGHVAAWKLDVSPRTLCPGGGFTSQPALPLICLGPCDLRGLLPSLLLPPPLPPTTLSFPSREASAQDHRGPSTTCVIKSTFLAVAVPPLPAHLC